MRLNVEFSGDIEDDIRPSYFKEFSVENNKTIKGNVWVIESF